MVVEEEVRFEYKVSKIAADELEKELLPFCKKFTVCGSVRRQKPTNGDIDTVAVIHNEKKFNECLWSMGALVLPTMAIGRTKEGIKFTIYFSKERYYGSMVWHFTGSNESNDRLRERAKSMGMILSQFGIYKDQKNIASETEEEIFRCLELDWIDPKDRI